MNRRHDTFYLSWVLCNGIQLSDGNGGIAAKCLIEMENFIRYSSKKNGKTFGISTLIIDCYFIKVSSEIL